VLLDSTQCRSYSVTLTMSAIMRAGQFLHLRVVYLMRFFTLVQLFTGFKLNFLIHVSFLSDVVDL